MALFAVGILRTWDLVGMHTDFGALGLAPDPADEAQRAEAEQEPST